MNSKVKVLGKRLYVPNLRDLAELESKASGCTINFPYVCMQACGKIL